MCDNSALTLDSVIILQCREDKVCWHLYNNRWSSISLWPPAVWHSQNNTPAQKCTAQQKKKYQNKQNKPLLRRIQLISYWNGKIAANLDKIQLSKRTFFKSASCFTTLFLSVRISAPWKICVQNSNEGKTQLNRECPPSNQELNMPDTKPANVTHVKPVAHQEGQQSQCAVVETNLSNTQDSTIKTCTLVSLSAALD